MRSIYHACLLLAVAALLLLVPITAAIAKSDRVIWKVPVFYVTDRQAKGKGADFGPRRLAEKDTVSGMQAGMVEVCVPGRENEKLADWQKNGLHFETCKRVDADTIKPFKCDSSADLSGEFDSAFLDTMKKCQRKDAFVFVHGFNNSFDAAADSAAQLSFYTGCPVILYSWPSAAKLYRYSLDECNNEWSQEHFNEFLEHLSALKQANGLQLNIVAHSMGNRLFVRGSPVLQGKGVFTDIFMVNPDFDAQTFVHYLSRYLPKDGVRSGVRGQLLVSRRDKALAAAEGLFGGYTRLGQGVDFTLSALTSPARFCKVWLDPSSSDEPEAKAAAESRVSSIERALRIVDVTALDHGILGHKVPFEYIASMHFNNRPPDGYELDPDASKGCNRISRFFARVCGQQLEMPVGQYMIVTKSKGNEMAADKVGQSDGVVAESAK